MRTLKQLIAIVLLILSVAAFTWVYFFMEINRENMIQAGQARAIESAARGEVVTGFVDESLGAVSNLFEYGIPLVFGFVMLTGTSLVGTYIYRKMWRDRNLPHDGVYALQRQKLILTDANGRSYPAIVTTNQNLLTSPILTQVLNGTSEGSYVQTNQLSEKGQLHAKTLERQANNLQAASFSDNLGRLTAGVAGKILSPKITIGGRSNEYQEEDRPLLTAGEEEEEAEEIAVVEPMSIGQAFAQSTNNCWIIGRDSEGNEATIDPKVTPHLAIFGKTRTGKSSGAAMMVAGHALKSGHKVIILDGDEATGGDWEQFSPICEYHKTEPWVFPYQVEMLYREYRRRGVERVDHDITVIIEEYGDINSRLPREVRTKTNAMLESLTRKAGKLGIHLVFVDQYPKYWDDLVFQNTTKIVYKLEEAAKLKVFNPEKLRDQGEFAFRGRQYDSFYAKPHTRRMLSMATKTYPMLIDEANYPYQDEPLPDDYTPETKEPIQADYTVVNNAQESTETDLVSVIMAYVEAHPELKRTPPEYGGITKIIDYVLSVTGKPVVKSYVSKILKEVRIENGGEA